MTPPVLDPSDGGGCLTVDVVRPPKGTILPAAVRRFYDDPAMAAAAFLVQTGCRDLVPCVQAAPTIPGWRLTVWVRGTEADGRRVARNVAVLLGHVRGEAVVIPPEGAS